MYILIISFLLMNFSFLYAAEYDAHLSSLLSQSAPSTFVLLDGRPRFDMRGFDLCQAFASQLYEVQDAAITHKNECLLRQLASLHKYSMLNDELHDLSLRLSEKLHQYDLDQQAIQELERASLEELKVIAHPPKSLPRRIAHRILPRGKTSNPQQTVARYLLKHGRPDGHTSRG